MLRRCLADYWEGERWGRKGKRYGGEGCVMIVDAAGAGYKNMVSLIFLRRQKLLEKIKSGREYAGNRISTSLQR